MNHRDHEPDSPRVDTTGDSGDDCARVQERLMALSDQTPTGELDKASLEAHLRECRECRSIADLHERLLEFGRSRRQRLEDVDLHEFEAEQRAEVRSVVMQQIGATVASNELGSTTPGDASSGQTALGSDFPRRLEAWHQRPLLRAAGFLLVVGAALVLGWRLGVQQAERSPASAGSVGSSESVPWRGQFGEFGESGPLVQSASLEPLVATVDALARGSVSPEVERPYEFSDVRVRSLDGNSERVLVSFDLLAHVEVERDRSDPLVVEALLQALESSNSLAQKVQAMEEATSLSDERIRSALVQAVRSDDSEVVRRLALERLVQGLSASTELQQTSRDEIEGVLLEVLREEPSVPMRLLALDGLTAPSVTPEAKLAREIEDALSVSPEVGREALRVRAEQTIHERASWGGTGRPRV